MAVSINQTNAMVQKLTDNQLMQEISNPTGVAPLSSLAQEAQKRAMMRHMMRNGPQGFADGGEVDDGGNADPPPAMPNPSDWRGTLAYASDPNNFLNAAMQNQGLAQLYGTTGPRQNMGQFISQMQGYMPNQTAPVFDKLTADAQNDLQDYNSQNKGRTLMQMGLAMMGSKDPSFLGALAAGGQAGLAQQDKIQAGRRALQQQVLQSQMAKAQSQQAYNSQIMQGAMNLNSDQNARYGQYAQGVMTQAGDAQRTALTGAQLNESAQEQAANRSNQLAVASMQERAAAARQQAEIADADKRAQWGMGIGLPSGSRQATPEQEQQYEQQATADIQQRLGMTQVLNGKTVMRPGAKAPGDMQDAVYFTAAQRMMMDGLTPSPQMQAAYQRFLPKVVQAHGGQPTTVTTPGGGPGTAAGGHGASPTPAPGDRSLNWQTGAAQAGYNVPPQATPVSAPIPQANVAAQQAGIAQRAAAPQAAAAQAQAAPAATPGPAQGNGWGKLPQAAAAVGGGIAHGAQAVGQGVGQALGNYGNLTSDVGTGATGSGSAAQTNPAGLEKAIIDYRQNQIAQNAATSKTLTTLGARRDAAVKARDYGTIEAIDRQISSAINPFRQ